MMGLGTQLLGHGGCGTVFKAVHEGTRTLLALKEINAMDKTSRDQMLNEVSQPAPPGSQSGTFWNPRTARV